MGHDDGIERLSRRGATCPDHLVRVSWLDSHRPSAHLLSLRYPDRLTIEFLKKERKGRVFVDWMRNGFGATGACPYSLRPREGAPIAMPIAWDELETTEPSQFRLREDLGSTAGRSLADGISV